MAIFILLNAFIPKKILKLKVVTTDPYAKKDPTKLAAGKSLKGGLLMKLVTKMNTTGMSTKMKETKGDEIQD